MEDIYVTGIKKHPKAERMYDLYMRCAQLGVTVPEEVKDYFNGEPNRYGIEIPLICEMIEDPDCEAIEISVDTLVKEGVSHIIIRKCR